MTIVMVELAYTVDVIKAMEDDYKLSKKNKS